MSGFASIGFYFIGLEKSIIEGADSYSRYANKKDWVKSLYRVDKEFLRNQVNFNSGTNLKALKEFGVINRIISYTEKINTDIQNDTIEARSKKYKCLMINYCPPNVNILI